MDKERAKFILRNFRPDGADTEDAQFTEALRLATSDRELGEWLVRERAFDAEFAESLARVNLPEGLRESVLLAMAQDGDGKPRVNLAEEKRMMNALGEVPIPPGLRDRVLEAMEQSANTQKKSPNWFRFAVPLAAAAAVILSFVFLGNTGQEKSGDGGDIVETAKMPIEAVPVSFVTALESPDFHLEIHHQELSKLVAHLEKNHLPYDHEMPPGLADRAGMACRELIIAGKRGSLICFTVDDRMVHLIVFKKEDLKGSAPDMHNPMIKREGGWTMAQWQSDDNVSTIMTHVDEKVVAAFF